jgi:uncharacterized protein
MATQMKRAFNPIVAAIVLVLSFDASLAAGQLEDGQEAYGKGDYATALRLLRPLADQGNAQAQNNLGAMYFTGYAAPPNYDEAAEWFRKAAVQVRRPSPGTTSPHTSTVMSPPRSSATR